MKPNSRVSLTRALEEGFGLETDLRDAAGQLVIGHDPPAEGAPHFLNLLEAWANSGVLGRAPLALNVKADGLVPLLLEAEIRLQLSLHYFFDMSFPQLRRYAQAGLPVALRVSEFEPLSRDLAFDLGLEPRYWLDGFESDWWLGSRQVEEVCRLAPVAVVSPEIHGRDPEPVWEWFAALLDEGCDISICTDYPFDVLDVIT